MRIRSRRPSWPNCGRSNRAPDHSRRLDRFAVASTAHSELGPVLSSYHWLQRGRGKRRMIFFSPALWTHCRPKPSRNTPRRRGSPTGLQTPCPFGAAPKADRGRDAAPLQIRRTPGAAASTTTLRRSRSGRPRAAGPDARSRPVLTGRAKSRGLVLPAGRWAKRPQVGPCSDGQATARATTKTVTPDRGGAPAVPAPSIAKPRKGRGTPMECPICAVRDRSKTAIWRPTRAA